MTAAVIVDDPGVVCGTASVIECADELGLLIDELRAEGALVRSGDVVCRFRASPKKWRWPKNGSSAYWRNLPASRRRRASSSRPTGRYVSCRAPGRSCRSPNGT